MILKIHFVSYSLIFINFVHCLIVHCWLYNFYLFEYKLYLRYYQRYTNNKNKKITNYFYALKFAYKLCKSVL